MGFWSTAASNVLGSVVGSVLGRRESKRDMRRASRLQYRDQVRWWQFQRGQGLTPQEIVGSPGFPAIHGTSGAAARQSASQGAQTGTQAASIALQAKTQLQVAEIQADAQRDVAHIQSGMEPGTKERMPTHVGQGRLNLDNQRLMLERDVWKANTGRDPVARTWALQQIAEQYGLDKLMAQGIQDLIKGWNSDQDQDLSTEAISAIMAFALGIAARPSTRLLQFMKRKWGAERTAKILKSAEGNRKRVPRDPLTDAEMRARARELVRQRNNFNTRPANNPRKTDP